MSFSKRTVTCGELRPENSGKEVVLNGWVHNNRDLGGLIFVDVRDRYGVTQAVVLPERNPELTERAKELRAEFVVAIRGVVRMRENPNPHIPTGLIEVLVDELHVINRAETPPFEINDEVEPNEELRLTYRYLDLRRPKIQRNFLMRNLVYQVAHEYFHRNGFVEIETPVLMKSTPEGARDYLVPSRLHNGNFYALPQSPQIYKQLLMMSGYDRYMQIVKCFRDEDLRADRQPEFSQIDVEMSFVDSDDVLSMCEGFIRQLWKSALNVDIEAPFARLTYREAMQRYGSDKPDLRYDLELTTVTDLLRNSEFGVFAGAAAAGGSIALLNAKGCSGYSRKMLDELTAIAKTYGAKGLAWMKVTADGVQSPIAKFLSDDEIAGIREAAGAEEGDLLLFGADRFDVCYTALGALRTAIAQREGLEEAAQGTYACAWVTDFPMFEFVPDENRYVAVHHPFAAPMEEDVALFDTDPGAMRAEAYDLVINGYECAGGSIRIHRNDVQSKVFKALGISAEEAREKFGFLLDALQYGAPPHGGIAFGLDRIVMILCGSDNLRDVIAFPKTTSALSLMDGAPSTVSQTQLDELGLTVTTDDA